MNKDQKTELTEAAASPSAPEYYSGIDWVSVLFRLLEKIHWIVLAALLGAVLAWFYVARIATPVYQATSKIYIAGSDTTISLSDLQMGSTLAVDYQEVFKIWHVHEMVDERLNLNYSYSELEKMISVNNPSGSHLLYIYVKSTDPAEAKLLADTYAEVVQDYIANKMELRKPQILEKARTPNKPISPNVTATVAKGALFGGLGIILILLFIFILDDRIRTGDDITKAVDLPTFGTVPRQNMERNAAEEEQDQASAPLFAEGKHMAVFRGNLKLDYAGEEAINAICSSITFAGKSMRRVLITSCGANEGKTFSALQIAIGMTRRGARVLLIDADLRLSVMKMKYDIHYDGQPAGLAHLLSGQCTVEDAVYHTNIPNLDLLPDGASIKTPLSLLTSPEFDCLMASVGEAYDLVIVDTPPLGAVVDAAEISRRCDGSLLVLEYNRTHGKSLKEAVRLLRQTETPVLGCIVNKAAVSRIGKSRYSYYYGGKYGYQKHDAKTDKRPGMLKRGSDRRA
ncbi:MAG: polysaccharide biosynthesis tyrosine autokinase [Clostridia bacterium]|nr:polysaccharide biosynthesis tyrosine autokinase [Clostridia bacterium]